MYYAASMDGFLLERVWLPRSVVVIVEGRPLGEADVQKSLSAGAEFNRVGMKWTRAVSGRACSLCPPPCEHTFTLLTIRSLHARTHLGPLDAYFVME